MEIKGHFQYTDGPNGIRESVRMRLHYEAEWKALSEKAREEWLNKDHDALGMRQKMKPEEYYFYKRWQLDA